MNDIWLYSKKDKCDCILCMIDYEFGEAFLKMPHKIKKDSYTNIKRKFSEIDFNTSKNNMNFIVNGLYN